MTTIETKFEPLYQGMLAVADKERSKKMAAYMRNQFTFLGVATPKRRALTKDFYREAKKDEMIDWAFVSQCWTCQYREFKYIAIGYLTALKKRLVPEDLFRLKKLAQTDSWWDTIDGLDRLVGEITFNYPEVKAVLIEWSKDQDFWLRDRKSVV